MKSKELYILTLGILTALTPFIGVQNAWKTVLYVVFGIAIAILAFLRRRELTRSSGNNDVFVENGIDIEHDQEYQSSEMSHVEENEEATRGH